jgi:hypothetical protein
MIENTIFDAIMRDAIPVAESKKYTTFALATPDTPIRERLKPQLAP